MTISVNVQTAGYGVRVTHQQRVVTAIDTKTGKPAEIQWETVLVQDFPKGQGIEQFNVSAWSDRRVIIEEIVE